MSILFTKRKMSIDTGYSTRSTRHNFLYQTTVQTEDKKTFFVLRHFLRATMLPRLERAIMLIKERAIYYHISEKSIFRYINSSVHY